MTEDTFRLETGSVSAQATDLLWFALVCGLLSFATIESVKRLTYVRAAYHEQVTRIWLQTRLHRISRDPRVQIAPFEQLIAAMGTNPGEQRRVFNLPSEQLAAQLSAAADLALTATDDYYGYFLASVTRDGRDLPLAEDGGELPPKPRGLDDDEEIRRAQQVRIGLDQLQVALRDPWRRYLWGSGLWISGAYGIGLAFAGHEEAVQGPRHVLAALVLGGVVAAIARDLTAIIERLRG